MMIDKIIIHNSLQPMLDELITEAIKSCDKQMLVDGTIEVGRNLEDGKIFGVKIDLTMEVEE